MSYQAPHVEYVEVDFTSSSEEESLWDDKCENEESDASDAFHHPPDVLNGIL